MHKRGAIRLARQTNILSFDEVKQGTRSRRPSAAALSGSSYPSASRANSGSFDRSGSSSRPSAPLRRFSSDPSAAGRAGAPPLRQAVRSEASVADRYGFSSGRADVAAGSRTARGARGFDAEPRRAKGASSRRMDDGRDGDSAEDAPAERGESRRASRKRARAKIKAGRAFAKQFGDTDSAASQTGSRAAVYKGEMGAKHRQAARMQGKAGSQASAKRGSTAGSGASLVSSPRFIACAAVAVCLALSCLFLYPSAQQYYQSVRDRDRLAAEYAALVERNGAIEGEVATLQTDSGIESRAHEQLGWVKDGEQTAKVSGLSASQDEGASVHANIVSGSIDAPETWYSPFLDPLFGVE